MSATTAPRSGLRYAIAAMGIAAVLLVATALLRDAPAVRYTTSHGACALGFTGLVVWDRTL